MAFEKALLSDFGGDFGSPSPVWPCRKYLAARAAIFSEEGAPAPSFRWRKSSPSKQSAEAQRSSTTSGGAASSADATAATRTSSTRSGRASPESTSAAKARVALATRRASSRRSPSTPRTATTADSKAASMCASSASRPAASRRAILFAVAASLSPLRRDMTSEAAWPSAAKAPSASNRVAAATSSSATFPTAEPRTASPSAAASRRPLSSAGAARSASRPTAAVSRPSARASLVPFASALPRSASEVSLSASIASRTPLGTSSRARSIAADAADETHAAIGTALAAGHRATVTTAPDSTSASVADAILSHTPRLSSPASSHATSSPAAAAATPLTALARIVSRDQAPDASRYRTAASPSRTPTTTPDRASSSEDAS
mmetsp:Transcript_5093/g.15410  ORF Transcript_5093/g.15410 Transcript_5093/m.15410 type:complete len:377 (+) Transcript_5093:899-2029(+)